MHNKTVRIRDKELLVESYGFNFADTGDWWYKYHNLIGNVTMRVCRSSGEQCKCDLSFGDYLQKAIDAGLTHPSQIGTSINSYHMGRLNDVGDYTIDNCRFITHAQNRQELVDNGGYKIGNDKKIGRTKFSHATIAMVAAKRTGMNASNCLGMATMAIKQSKRFVLLSPDGSIHRGLNLKKFCLDNNLNQGNMGSVCRGEKKSHKGWTGTYE